MVDTKETHKTPLGVVKEVVGVKGNLQLQILFVEAGVDRTDRWRDLHHIMYEQVYSQREDKELCSLKQWLDRIDHMIHSGECYMIYVTDLETNVLKAAAMTHLAESLHYGTVLSITGMVNTGGAKCSKLLLAAYEYVGKLNNIRHYMRYAYRSRGRYDLIFKEFKWAV